MVYIYTTEYYLAIKRNENMSFARKWIELEIITMSKINQAQKEKYGIFSLICGI
jgi:hypothetical protein